MGTYKKKGDPSKAATTSKKWKLNEQLTISSEQLGYFTVVYYHLLIEQALTKIDHAKKGLQFLNRCTANFHS